jgi:hypothetical protein
MSYRLNIRPKAEADVVEALYGISSGSRARVTNS